jgi:integrase
MLARWWGETGSPTNPKALLFKGTAKSGNISPVPALRTLRRAMEAAAVPLEGPDYGLPRNLHSCRHSFARMALEAGETITWLSNHLGHADLATTDRCYSHFSREEGKRAAARVGKRIAKLTAQTGAQTLPAATAYPAPLR